MNNSTTNKDGKRESTYRGDEGRKGIKQQKRRETRVERKVSPQKKRIFKDNKI